MPELRITAALPLPSEALAQAAAITAFQAHIDAFSAAVAAVGGDIRIAVVKPRPIRPGDEAAP
jgi:hypothetical protein